MLAAGALIAAAVGCASSDSEAPASQGDSAQATAESLTVQDPWVKAADEGMTAAFGVLVNDGDADVTVVERDLPHLTDGAPRDRDGRR